MNDFFIFLILWFIVRLLFDVVKLEKRVDELENELKK